MFNDNKAYKVFCSYLREGLDSMINVYTIWFTDLQMRETSQPFTGEVHLVHCRWLGIQ